MLSIVKEIDDIIFNYLISDNTVLFADCINSYKLYIWICIQLYAARATWIPIAAELKKKIGLRRNSLLKRRILVSRSKYHLFTNSRDKYKVE